jgi:beta-glucanase (GH16 family)
MHYGGAWPNNRYITHEQNWGFDLTNSFHEYSLEWTHETAIFRVDNVEHFRSDLNKNWYSGVGPNPYTANYQPWDQRMHFLINLAIGGGFFGGMGNLSPQQADAWADPTLAVDWVRVYQQSSGNPTPVTTGSRAVTTGSRTPATTTGSQSSGGSGSSGSSGSGTGAWVLQWADEFDGPNINMTKWAHEVDCWGGGNGELQCYTARPDNSYIQNGKLILRAKQETYTGTANDCTSNNGGCTNTMQYTSARLRTLYAPDGSWKYGKVMMNAKLPNGAFLWPAFWMLPSDYVYGPWAASGEFDIMEMRGQNPTTSSSAMHYGGAWPNNRYITHEQNWGVDLTNSFHTFALEWNHQNASFSMDGRVHWTVDLNRNWYSGVGPNPYTANYQPWDQRFHLLLNLAIGGGFFGGMGSLTPQQAQAWADPTYAIDWIRVYQWQEGASASTTGNGGSGSGSGSGSVTTGSQGSGSGSGSGNGGSGTTGSQGGSTTGRGRHSRHPRADSYVRGGAYSTANFGTESDLSVKYSTNADFLREAYMRFDFTADDIDRSSLSSCVLRVNVQSIAPAVETNGALTVGAYLVLNPNWNSDGLTFANKPTVASSPFDTETIASSGVTSVSFDCTSAMTSIDTSDISVKIAVMPGANDQSMVSFYSSRASDTTVQPVMSVDDSGSAPSSPAAQVDGNVSASAGGASNTGLIAGVVIGVVALLVIVAAVAFFIGKFKRRGPFKSWY